VQRLLLPLLLLTVTVAARVEALAEWADRGLVGVLGRGGGRVAMASSCFGEHGGRSSCQHRLGQTDRVR
jgi:hypothetical protein